ncbi:MAG: BMC domain-containing protein [Clostridia bacterium]|nr:BMC domain-containing protein [Clostridia bacterium]
MDFSLGLVEVSSLGNAIMMLDEMLKVADVEFIAVERKLGGRLVTIVVRGSISSVTASVETGRRFAESIGCLKSAEVIARPHPEILKFIHLDKENEPAEKQEKPVAVEALAAAKTPKAEKPTAAKTSKTTKSKAKKASDIKKQPKEKGKK